MPVGDLKICVHHVCQAMSHDAAELPLEQDKAYRLRVLNEFFSKRDEPSGVPAGSSSHLRAGIGPDGVLHDLAVITKSGYDPLDRFWMDSASFRRKVEAPPNGADMWLYFHCDVSASRPFFYGLVDPPSSPYLGKSFDAPQLLYSVNPKFPSGFRKNRGATALVVVHLTIDTDGVPRQLSVKSSSNPALDKTAIDAVKRYRFKPAMVNGQPFAAQVEVEVHFEVL